MSLNNIVMRPLGNAITPVLLFGARRCASTWAAEHPAS
jgi:hypothetical protein